MRIRNSIAIPIVFVLLAIAVGILAAGYFINRGVFYDVFEERESNKAGNIRLTITSLISGEMGRIAGLSKVLGKDTDVYYGLYHYGVTKGDLKPLKNVMEQLQAQANLQIFSMADPGGKILCDAGRTGAGGTIRNTEAFARALRGEEFVSASRTPVGWGLRRYAPIYVFGKKRPTGILILGTGIDDDFARKIAAETGSQIFIATPEGVIAGSYELRDPASTIDPSLVKNCIAGEKPVFFTDRGNFRSLSYFPFRIADAKFCLVIETDIGVVKELLSRNRIRMVQWGLVIFIGITAIGVALTFTLIRPLGRLQEEARQVIREYSGAELSTLPRGNEISTLVRAIRLMVETMKNHMSERAKAEERLRQAQKMEAVGRLAGGVAHDFNNLLSVITGYSELLLLRFDGRTPGCREIEEIHKAGVRAASLTHQLLAFSRRQVLKPRLLQLNEVVSNLGRMLARLIGEQIEIATVLRPDLWTVEADPNQIEQILMNFAVNARDAMPGGGILSISTDNAALEAPFVEGNLHIPAGSYVTLKVSDTGCGMDAETVSRIFEPFFTTKEQGKGTGLGLATVYGIVKQSGGFIHVRSDPGSGTAFKVFLPRAEREAPGTDEEPPDRGERRPSGNGTVLVVEDDDMVRKLVCEAIRGFGYTVLEARHGEEALSIVDCHEGTIHLLITDVVMPGMNGLELARRLKSSRPDLPVLFMSGYAEEAVRHLGAADPGKAFLQKPITPASLAAKLAEILPEGESATVR
jgi:signal transduction histidine kinase/CheY-like chemotaxis protein